MYNQQLMPGQTPMMYSQEQMPVQPPGYQAAVPDTADDHTNSAYTTEAPPYSEKN